MFDANKVIIDGRTAFIIETRNGTIEIVQKKNELLEHKWLRVMQLVEQFAPVGSPLYHSVFPRLERRPLPSDGRMLQIPIHRNIGHAVQDNRHTLYADLEVANLNELAVVLHEYGHVMQAVMLADGKRYYVNTDFYKEVPMPILTEMVMKLFTESLAELKASKNILI